VRTERLLLEYDDARSGSFEALKEVPEDKTVVLGLITTKRRLEPMDELESRIREASRFVPLERLAVSPQCGFSSSVVGAIAPADQERKLRLVVETARRVWGEDAPPRSSSGAPDVRSRATTHPDAQRQRSVPQMETPKMSTGETKPLLHRRSSRLAR
jgi:hypothetical protein